MVRLDFNINFENVSNLLLSLRINRCMTTVHHSKYKLHISFWLTSSTRNDVVIIYRLLNWWKRWDLHPPHGSCKDLSPLRNMRPQKLIHQVLSAISLGYVYRYSLGRLEQFSCPYIPDKSGGCRWSCTTILRNTFCLAAFF